MTRHDYAVYVLTGLVGNAYRGPSRAVVAWMLAESGERVCDGTKGARFNPLNTTLSVPGATNYNNIGVKNYPTWNVGVSAVIQTLRESRYVDVRAVLGRRYVLAKQVMEVIGVSPWGTPTELLLGALGSYQANRTFYNGIQVGPV